MITRWAVAILFLSGLMCVAQDEKCFVCDRTIAGTFYRVTDYSTDRRVAICVDCEKQDARCFACGLPVKPDARRLQDGRRLCARDEKNAIQSDEEARELAEALRDDLDRQFSRFMTFPSARVTVTIVDQFNLQSLFKSPGYEQACSSVFGATSTHRLPDGTSAHSISLLSTLSKPRLRAVAAHEFAHAWMGENVSLERRQALAPETTEGFCEWIAYHRAEADQEPAEQRAIQRNNYTRGQLEAFLAAEVQLGFNAVLEWVKSGEDNRLNPLDLNRVRLTRSEPKPTPTPASTPYHSTPAPPPVPDKLILKGISGSSNRRFALINDKTLMAGEQGRVRVGDSNILVHCFEIRSNSVLIQAGNAKEKLELHLGGE